jgi:hypothetical protein
MIYPTKCESAAGLDLIIFMRQFEREREREREREEYATRMKLMDEVETARTSSKPRS